MIDQKWDSRFLELAQVVSTWSKDPSTQTGAVIVRPDKTVVSLGFNGFPPGLADTMERLSDRQLKYEYTVHCEMNALLLTRESVKGCTLYTWPFLSCCRCAVHVVRAGIARVVAPSASEDLLSRWADSLARTKGIYAEVGISVDEYELPWPSRG